MMIRLQGYTFDCLALFIETKQTLNLQTPKVIASINGVNEKPINSIK